MPAGTKTFTLPDDRTVAWCEYGSDSSPYPPIFYLHGSPSSRFEGALYHDKAQSLNLPIISPDRPSSGLSSPCPERTFLTYPSDLLALAAHLDIPKFHLIGSSGGCPYLLACLKEIPRDVCLGGQIVSGVYPTKLGMEVRFIQKAMLWLSYYSPATTGTLMDWSFGSSARDPDTSKLTKTLAGVTKTMPARDQEAAAQAGFMGIIESACREAFRQHGDAAASEFGLWSRDWGFELKDIDGKGLGIWHGKEDGNCGFSSAEKAAAQLEEVDARFLEGEGHYVSAFYGEEILRRFLP